MFKNFIYNVMITIFENYNINKYWLVPTDERFVKSLQDLGCDKKFINYQSKNENIQLTKFVYVGIGNRVSSYEWSWSSYSDDGSGRKSFEDLNYKYMGTINIEYYEFEINKYNL